MLVLVGITALGCSGGNDSNDVNKAGSAATTGGSAGTAGASNTGATSTAPEAGATDQGADPSDGACDVVVYDGEQGSHPSSTDGLVYVGWPMETNHAKDIGDAKFGSIALQNALDPNGTCCGTFYYSWSNWDMDKTKIIDATKFDSLEFWIKVESGMYWNLQIELQDVNMKASFTGNDIHIADYIDGKNIDTTWRKATVPVSVFNTNGIDLTHISSFIIEGDRAVTFDLDEVKFTKASCP